MLLKKNLANIMLILLTLIAPFKSLASDLSYDKIVFFGDSLTDNGNFFKKLFGLAPKPPYFEGRFTNGHTWAENVATYFDQEYHIKSENNAVGGASTVLHNPFKGNLPFTLSDSINSYLIHTNSQDRSRSLFVIWIGSNDYLYGASNVDERTLKVVSSIKNNIERLIAKGGKNFLVLNIADIARTPQGLTGGKTQNVADLTLAHNEKLEILISELQKSNKTINIHLFDIYRFSSDLIQHPEKYNEQLHTNFSVMSEPCWQGSYIRGNSLNQLEDLTNSIEEKINSQELTSNRSVNTNEHRKEAEELARYITSTPDLSVAYNISESYEHGEKACANPENYIFWDKVHPTAAVHAFFSAMIIDFINQNYP